MRGIFKFLSGVGGARSVVRFVFAEFVKFNSQLQATTDNTFLFNATTVFNTESQARAFILNLIFLKRVNNTERESYRCKLEIETHGKMDRFEFVTNGEKSWAELYNFQNLGDLICTIWYIESGLRSNYDYGSFGGAFDLLPGLDEYSSRVITAEYEEQCEMYSIDDFIL
jgi:hypothetical protein